METESPTTRTFLSVVESVITRSFQDISRDHTPISTRRICTCEVTRGGGSGLADLGADASSSDTVSACSGVTDHTERGELRGGRAEEGVGVVGGDALADDRVACSRILLRIQAKKR